MAAPISWKPNAYQHQLNDKGTKDYLVQRNFVAVPLPKQYDKKDGFRWL
jgi:hypothetical protein